MSQEVMNELVNMSQEIIKLKDQKRELLGALKLSEGNISSLLASAHPKVFGEWLETVRAAISKAEGEKA